MSDNTMLINTEVSKRCARVALMAYNDGEDYTMEGSKKLFTSDPIHFNSLPSLENMAVVIENGSDLYIGFAGTMAQVFDLELWKEAWTELWSGNMEGVEKFLLLARSVDDWITNFKFDLVPYGQLEWDYGTKAIKELIVGLSEFLHNHLSLPLGWVKWLTDTLESTIQHALDFFMTVYPESWRVHQGFMGATLESILLGFNQKFLDAETRDLTDWSMDSYMLTCIISRSFGKKNIYITGHSQGGAKASLSVPIVRWLSIGTIFSPRKAGLMNSMVPPAELMPEREHLLNRVQALQAPADNHPPNLKGILPKPTGIQLCTFASPNPGNMAMATSMNWLCPAAVAFQNVGSNLWNFDPVPFLLMPLNESNLVGYWIAYIYEKITSPDLAQPLTASNETLNARELADILSELAANKDAKLNAESTQTLRTAIQKFKSSPEARITEAIELLLEDRNGGDAMRVFATVNLAIAIFYDIDLKMGANAFLTMMTVAARFGERLGTSEGNQFFTQWMRPPIDSDPEKVDHMTQQLWEAGFDPDKLGLTIDFPIPAVNRWFGLFKQYAQVGSQLRFAAEGSHTMKTGYLKAAEGEFRVF